MPVNSVTWACSLEDTCRLQAWLHQFWRQHPLRTQLPTVFPTAYHVAWAEFPLWPGDVPQELFIATDGSGLGHGSSAFAAWALHRHRWYRIGWYASDLPSIAWSEVANQPTGQRSFLGEIVALHSAALWALSMCDCWQLYMGCRPSRITVAVDNTSALQVAAGMASAHGRPAQWCRAGWQAVQARCSTHFRHVPSHSGFLVNTIADTLADHASKFTCGVPLLYHSLSALHRLLEREGPWLWLLPAAVMHQGVPAYLAHVDPSLVFPAQEEASPVSHTTAQVAGTSPLPLHIVTANVQSLKDVPGNPFNPSGHAARRQYFYDQLQRLRVDVACLQETRSWCLPEHAGHAAPSSNHQPIQPTPCLGKGAASRASATRTSLSSRRSNSRGAVFLLTR